MVSYKTPGVYVEEIPKLPPSIAAVETAIPVFIGYTEKAMRREEDDLRDTSHRITSLFDYVRFYGEAKKETGIRVTITQSNPRQPAVLNGKIENASYYKMYYALQAFYANGGGPAYIISIGDYSAAPVVDLASLLRGLGELEKVDEVTLIVFPDAQGVSSASDYYTLYGEAMDQCEKLGDRFTVMDVWLDPSDPEADHIQTLRNSTPSEINTLKYGAAYYPNLDMGFDYQYNEADVMVVQNGGNTTLPELKSTRNDLYNLALNAINQIPMTMPPSPAVVGQYATVDNTRGVWKAPANVNIDFAIKPVVKITDEEQENINVDVVAGKSVNAIRAFTGRGPAIIWGARTLAGNDNEWRYVSVRRFFNFVEESVKKATAQFVFEPNDKNTWTRVRSMIENFLVLQWRAGALMGVTPEEAFYVRVGLNVTMDEFDIFEGRMIIEIGMAVVRPAEFIILRFSHKMLQES